MDSNYFSTLLGFSAGLLLVISLVLLAILILLIVTTCKLYQKAGEPAWEAIVPFYSSYIFSKICGLHWMYFLFLIAPNIISILGFNELENVAYLIELYGFYMCCYNLSKKFHQSVGFSVGMFLLPVIFFPMLAFSKNYQYDSSVAVSEHGAFGKVNSNIEKTTASDVTVRDEKVAFCPDCGTKVNTEVDKFCPNCGKEINK